MGNEKVENYDLTIIGGGAGGYTAALEAGKQGFKVALIEKDRIGGTCLNRGCVPTQSLLRDLIAYSSLMANETIDKDPLSTRINFKKIMDRKNQVVDLLVTGTEKTLLRYGVSIIRGEGSFVDSQTIAVRPSNMVIRSKFVVIATGASSKPEPPFEIDHRLIWDSTDAIQAASVPKAIAIIGSGHRAMTFSDIFYYLGSQVSIITEGSRILFDQDRGVSDRYRKVLKGKKINVFLRSKVIKVKRGGTNGGIELTVECDGKNQQITVQNVLIPGQRQSNVEGLNLDKIGLSLREGILPVNSHLATNITNLYAIGDVIGGKYAAHKSMAEGMTVVKNISGGNAKLNYHYIPVCLYTNPEVATIGLTQEEAEKEGYDVAEGNFTFGAGARAIIYDQAEGFMKVLIDKKYGEILGAYIIGPQATELIALVSMAMQNELSLSEVKEVIYAHPSFGENFLGAVNDALSVMVSH